MRAKRGSLPLFVLTLFLSGVLETQGESKPLLVPTRRQGSLKLKPNPTVIQQRTVVVDLSQLKRRDNRRLQLPLFKGAEIALVRDEKESGPSGVFVWEGEVEGQPGSMAILATEKDVLVGDVMTRDAKGAFGFYQIRYLGNGVHVLKEVDQSKFPAEGEVDGQPRSMAILATAKDVLAGDGMTRDPKGAFGFYPVRYSGNGVHSVVPDPTPVPTSDLCGDPASRIDALVIYTDAARDATGGKDAIRLLIESAVRSTNRSYRKSEVTQRLRLVHVQGVDYRESGSTETDRKRLQNTSDSHLQEVLALRDAHAADVVVLIVDETVDCGWSKVMPTMSHQNETQAYAVVPYDCAGLPMWSFAHELGHIMGARHNREDDKTEGEPFPFNHGLVATSPTAGSPWHTIMAKRLEGCGEDPPGKCSTRIPRWSNPGVSYPGASGNPTGTADTDNHRVLEETALTVANFRCAPR